MNIAFEIIVLIAAYLCGSLPFGYWITKRVTGKNILELGSGNIGSTNVRRIAGERMSNLTQVLDMMKGLLPVLVVWLLREFNITTFEPFFIYLVALAAILGHNYSIFLSLKGGKGVNATLGATVLLSPISVFGAVLIYFLVKKLFHYVSLGSLFIAVSMPLIDVFIHPISYLTYYLLICTLLIGLRHIPNIKRLIAGTENKVE